MNHLVVELNRYHINHWNEERLLNPEEFSNFEHLLNNLFVIKNNIYRYKI